MTTLQPSRPSLIWRSSSSRFTIGWRYRAHIEARHAIEPEWPARVCAGFFSAAVAKGIIFG
jgi:hypothetical protein